MPVAVLASLLALAAQPASSQPVAAPASSRPAPAPSSVPAKAPARTSPAVIERNDVDVVANADGTFVATRTLTARIDREEAIRGASTLPISVSRSLQKFELVEAWTETADHRRLPVSPESIVTQAPPYAAQMQTLSDIELKVVNFPGVGVGSRIHLVTRVTQTTPYFPNAYMFDLAPGHAVPVLAGAVRLSMPKNMTLHIDADGIGGGAPKTSGDRRQYDWHYAVTDYRLAYPGEVGPMDQAPRLIVTSMDDWAALAKAYQNRATGPETPSPAIRALADRLTAGARDDRERVRILAKWVALNVRYLNIVLGVGGFVPDSADIVLQTRYGDCKGHATILNALLAAKGIDSTSVLINSTAVYREPSVAGQVFNHMINYVPSLDLFVDTTDPFAILGDLPAADRDKFVVLTRSGKTRRTPARGLDPDAMASDSAITIHPDGAIDGTTRIAPTGSYLGALRGLAVAARNQDPARIASDLMRKNGAPGSGSVTLPNPDAADAAIVLDTSWHLDDAATVDGTGAMRVPAPMALESIASIAASASGPLPSVTVVCGAIGLTERTVIRFPDTMTILSVPPAVKVDTPEIGYTADWTRAGQTISVVRTYASRYPGRTCSPQTIAAAQAAKRQIARDIGAQIVYRSGPAAAAATPGSSARSARLETLPFDRREPRL